MKELTVKQYAELVGITTQGVYKAIGNGSIPHKKVLVSREMTVIEVSDEDMAKYQ